jgi:hypothetical protein
MEPPRDSDVDHGAHSRGEDEDPLAVVRVDLARLVPLLQLFARERRELDVRRRVARERRRRPGRFGLPGDDDHGERSVHIAQHRTVL